MAGDRSARVTPYSFAALIQTLLLTLICLLGCGGPSVENLQSSITAATQKTAPSTDLQQIGVHRANVSQAVAESLQKASADVRPRLLQHCRLLAAEEFRLTYGYATIAEAESLHFLATLGGIQEAVWTQDKTWGEQCLSDLLPNESLQAEWLRDEVASQAKIQNFLKGLQAAHAELLRVSSRAVSTDALHPVLDRMLELAFRCQTAGLRTAIISGLLELWPAERSLIAKLLDQRLQKGEDLLAIAVYETYSSELPLSVPLAVLRQQLQTASEQASVTDLVQVILAYQQRAEQLGVSADEGVSDALQTATQRSLAAWGSNDNEADYLGALRDSLSPVRPQLAASIQQQIERSLPAQLQSALSTGDEQRIRDCLKRAGRLGLNPEQQRAVVENLTAADSAESSRQRLSYAAALETGPERMTLLRSVLIRKSLTTPVLQAALRLPRSAAEWSLVGEMLQDSLSSMSVSAEDLFLLAVDLPADAPRTLLLSQAFQRKPPDVPWLRVLTRIQLADAEVAELSRTLESGGDEASGAAPGGVDVDGYVSLLRQTPSAALARLIVARIPRTTEFSLAQLRQLLTPDPVPGLQGFLSAAAGRALERAAKEPASQSFSEALEFYERYRDVLQLKASPALLQATFENALSGVEPNRVAISLRDLLTIPELLSEKNGQLLREFIVAQLRRHAAQKQPVHAATIELLTALKTNFAAEQESVSSVWTELLLADTGASATLRQNIQAAENAGFVRSEKLAEAMLQRLRTAFPAPVTADEFLKHSDQFFMMKRLFEGHQAVAPLLQAEQTRWSTLVSDRVQALQQDYAGLEQFQPVLEKSGLEQLQQASVQRLLELSPLDDAAAIRRDTVRYLKLPGQRTEQATPAASRRLLRYAISGRDWSLAEQQLRLLKSAGALDASEQAAEASLQNVFFALQLARSWQGRRIPMNIVRTVEGRRQQINIDLLLKQVQGEDVSGTTAIENLAELGTFSGRIVESGLELTFTGDSLLLLNSDAKLSVTLSPDSIRSRYDDLEFSGMDRGSRLLVGELPDGDILFLDLPRNVIPLKPRWEGLSEYGERRWFVPPALDENNRLYFQTAVARNLGGQGHKLTFAIADLTKHGDVIIRGDLIYVTATPQPKSLAPEVRFLRNAELNPFAAETIPLRPNTGENANLGRHYGRQRIELRVPRDTRLLILEFSANGNSVVWFNGISLELPEAAVPAEPESTN